MLIMIFQISQLVLDLIIFQIFALCSCLHVNDSYRILVDCSWHVVLHVFLIPCMPSRIKLSFIYCVICIDKEISFICSTIQREIFSLNFGNGLAKEEEK